MLQILLFIINFHTKTHKKSNNKYLLLYLISLIIYNNEERKKEISRVQSLKFLANLSLRHFTFSPFVFENLTL